MVEKIIDYGSFVVSSNAVLWRFYRKQLVTLYLWTFLLFMFSMGIAWICDHFYIGVIIFCTISFLSAKSIHRFLFFNRPPINPLFKGKNLERAMKDLEIKKMRRYLRHQNILEPEKLIQLANLVDSRAENIKYPPIIFFAIFSAIFIAGTSAFLSKFFSFADSLTELIEAYKGFLGILVSLFNILLAITPMKPVFSFIINSKYHHLKRISYIVREIAIECVGN